MKALKNILPCIGKTDNKEQTPLQEKFFLIFFGNIIFVAATNLLTPLFALFVAQISPLDSASTAGLLWGAFIAATVTFLSVFSYIEWFNKLHDADLLVAGMLLKMAGWGMYVAMPGIGTMFCAQLFLGAGEAAGTPAFNALITDASIKSNVAPRKIFGMWQVAASVSMALAAVAGGYVVKSGGFKALFICMIVLSGLSAVATMVFRRELISLRQRHGNDVCVEM